MCDYPGCTKHGKYQIGQRMEGELLWKSVCSLHDSYYGLQNLMEAFNLPRDAALNLNARLERIRLDER